MQIANGSDKILVFGTYTAPSTGDTSWGTLTGCKVLPMETSCSTERSYDTEEVQYKASLNVDIASGKSTVKDTLVKAIKYSISGSCYAPVTADSFSVTIDQLRWLADHATTADGIKTVAIISRPQSVTATSSSTADDLVAQWCPAASGPDIVLPVRVSAFTEPSEAGQLVKVDATFEQAGQVLYQKGESW